MLVLVEFIKLISEVVLKAMGFILDKKAESIPPSMINAPAGAFY